MSGTMLFEGFAAAFKEEELQPITRDLFTGGAAPARMPDGIPDVSGIILSN